MVNTHDFLCMGDYEKRAAVHLCITRLKRNNGTDFVDFDMRTNLHVVGVGLSGGKP